MYFKLKNITNLNLNDIIFLTETFDLNHNAEYELNDILKILNDYEMLFGNNNYILNLKKKIYYFMNENCLINKLFL